MRMEEAIISNCRCHSQTQMTGDEDDATPRFVIDLLKNRITALENELSKKDAIVDYLTEHLVISNENKSHSNSNSINDKVIVFNNRNTLRKVSMVGLSLLT